MLDDTVPSLSEPQAQLWLHTAKLARKAGVLKTAQAAALHAQQLGLPMAAKQLAKLYWQNDQQRRAIEVLETVKQQTPDQWTAIDRHERAKVSGKMRFFSLCFGG